MVTVCNANSWNLKRLSSLHVYEKYKYIYFCCTVVKFSLRNWYNVTQNTGEIIIIG